MKPGDKYNEEQNQSITLPNPKTTRKFKLNSKKWQKDTIKYYINSKDRDYGNRKTPDEIQGNWNFYNTYLTKDEIKMHLDPHNVTEGLTEEDEAGFQFYNILNSPFDTLIGEELKRKFDVKAYAVNPDIVNSKDQEFQQRVIDYLQQQIQSEEPLNEEQLQQELKKFDKYRAKDLQTSHERMANEILRALKEDKRINAKYEFNAGFLNRQITNEEIYRVYHIGKEVRMKLVDSKNFYVVGMNGPFIEDADAWVEEEYLSPYRVIDEFSNELTDTEIKRILEAANANEDSFIAPKRMILVENELLDKNEVRESVYVKNSEISSNNNLSLEDWNAEDYTDEFGNVRVQRVQFKTLRKIGLLTTHKPDGTPMTKWIDEEYPIKPELGESVEWTWISDLWEGALILDNIFKKVRPVPVQMRSLLNPSIVRPSYVGYVGFNFGGKGQCRLDRLKPYQRAYNVWKNKLISLWMDNIGTAAVIDVAKIPSDMDTDEWYYWLKKFHIMYENSFEEGDKGAAKGLIAGNMQQSAKTIDLSLAQDINQAIAMLNYIENKVNEISAIPEARQGNMQGNEGLGTSQQAVINSSSRTEHDFFVHDMIKARVYEVMLEYAKWLWRDEELKLQYTTSNMSDYIIRIDGPLLAEAELGVAITNTSESFEMAQIAKQLLHPIMQNQAINPSDALMLLMHGTPNDIIEGLREAEQQKREENSQLEQQKAEAQKQMLAMQDEIDEKKHRRAIEMEDRKHQHKLAEIQEEKLYDQEKHMRDTNQNHIDDVVELEKVDKEVAGKKEMEQMKIDADREKQAKELASKEKIAKLQAQKRANANKKS